jgi:hypothetical protein
VLGCWGGVSELKRGCRRHVFAGDSGELSAKLREALAHVSALEEENADLHSQLRAVEARHSQAVEQAEGWVSHATRPPTHHRCHNYAQRSHHRRRGYEYLVAINSSSGGAGRGVSSADERGVVVARRLAGELEQRESQLAVAASHTDLTVGELQEKLGAVEHERSHLRLELDARCAAKRKKRPPRAQLT